MKGYTKFAVVVCFFVIAMGSCAGTGNVVPARLAQPVDGLGVPTVVPTPTVRPVVLKELDGCTQESPAYFYGFSLGPNYVYTQDRGDTLPKAYPKQLEAQRGALNTVQIDIWARDDSPLFRVESSLVPVRSAQQGSLYGFTSVTLRFQNMFWRHQPLVAGTPAGIIGGQPMMLEGRTNGMHLWTLKIGTERWDPYWGEQAFDPLCSFSVFVNFHDG